MKNIILDLCSGTCSWSRPYKEAGYEVISVDLPLDVRLLEKQDKTIYGILAAPPCRCFSYAGNAMKKSMTEMIDALSVVDACLRAVIIYHPKFWALENPRGKLTKYLGEPNYKFQPWFFGGRQQKLTYLWGKFNEPKQEVFKRPAQIITTNNIGRSGDYRRAITPKGFAEAFFRANSKRS